MLSSRFELNTKSHMIASTFFAEQDSHSSILFKQSIIELLRVNLSSEKSQVNMNFTQNVILTKIKAYFLLRLVLLEIAPSTTNS